MKKLLLGIVAIIQLVPLYEWRICRDFKFITPFSVSDLGLKLDDAIHNDIGISFLQVRFFHNKVTLGIFEILKKYILLWDSRLIVSLASFTALVGLLFAIWYVIPEKRQKTKMVIASIILLPILVVFIPSSLHVYLKMLLWAVYSSLSLYGWWNFLKRIQNKWIIFTFLAINSISLGYIIVFLNSSPYFCIK